MTGYANIGGMALVFFVFTALASSEDSAEDGSLSTRSTLVILLSAMAFGFVGEYATKIADTWTSFFVALGAAAGIGGPYALLRLLTKKRDPEQADNKAS